MGQYFKIVNLTKQEYLNPHSFDAGLKLSEIWSARVMMEVLTELLATTAEGEDNGPMQYHGRWCGDKIAIVGDYATGEYDGLYSHIYEHKDQWKDISAEIVNQRDGEPS